MAKEGSKSTKQLFSQKAYSKDGKNIFWDLWDHICKKSIYIHCFQNVDVDDDVDTGEAASCINMFSRHTMIANHLGSTSLFAEQQERSHRFSTWSWEQLVQPLQHLGMPEVLWKKVQSTQNAHSPCNVN